MVKPVLVVMTRLNSLTELLISHSNLTIILKLFHFPGTSLNNTLYESGQTIKGSMTKNRFRGCCISLEREFFEGF